ncbi:hypothetical protein C8R45DRAFT_1113546 [Mycena sanguinolenta]|nr:hypothetical protein C8R45DRAFT_1113546 [Mycena sanguinolenta]
MGRKGKFNDAQDAHSNTYMDELVAKLDAGMIVRKFTNYYNNVYKKTHPDEPSAPELIKSNPLLKFNSVLSGPQRAADTGINEVAAYQIMLKEKWDALSEEEQNEWDSQAEDEAGDVELNQKDFASNIHLALRTLCQGGIVGDAELMLFYSFRNTKTGELVAGTVHGHCKQNTANFGGEDLQNTYGMRWAQFADSMILRPQFPTIASATVDDKGTVIFPAVDLEKIPVVELRVLLDEYLQQHWVNRPCRTVGELPVPWDEIIAAPRKFYDTERFTLPFSLKSPVLLNTIETLALGEYFNSTRCSGPFYFNNPQSSSPPASRQSSLPVVEPNTPAAILPQATPSPSAPTSPPSHPSVSTTPPALSNQEATKGKKRKRKATLMKTARKKTQGCQQSD